VRVADRRADRRFLETGLRDGRQPAIAARGMVVTPHSFATLTGLDVLRSGGNAIDAALAVSAALMVAVPHQTGPGGDAWWMVRPHDGPVQVLNASGRSSRHASADELRAAGWPRVADREVHAVTAPAVAAGWREVHARWATRSLPDLFRPAVAAAEDGLLVSPNMARQLELADPVLARDASASAIFRPGGRPLRVGERLVQAELAATIRELGEDPRSIHEGRLADAVAAAVRDRRGWLDETDLAGVTATWERPLSCPSGGWEVLEAPPNSQGMAALVALALRERAEAGLARVDAVTDLHLSVEAARIAMAVRDAAVADPDRMVIEPAEILRPGTIEALAAAIDPERAAGEDRLAAAVGRVLGDLAPRRGSPSSRGGSGGTRPHPGTDTAHFVVIDRDGFAVSCIQSLFSAFGSGIVVPGTGVILHNRGAGFSLEAGRPNELRPLQRPMHTLAPAMATAGKRLQAVFGCMGGHAQTQIHLQMVQGLARDGLDPATVTARPRWFARPDPDSGAPEVLVESRLRSAARLPSFGHAVVRLGPFADVMGHEQVVLVDSERGALLGAADPRSDGIALGF
jgi:gamma-glutamyltranspeptidase/glutathione hydrolase